MKKLLAIFVMLLPLYPVLCYSQNGKVFDNLAVHSKILNRDRKFSIYLPPDYETSNRSYPVLYLLHGGLDDQTGWVQYGEVMHIADKAIDEGNATPMIIVMPDGFTVHPGFFNYPSGEWNYEDFFFKELIPFIEKNYRVKTEKKFRAVSGLSMGGGAAFIYALHHAEMFSSSCPLSGDIGPVAQDDARKMLTRGNPNIADSVVTNYYNNQSVIALVNNIPDTLKKAVRWYIAVGDKDGLSEGNALVHIAMRKKNIPHEFRVTDAGHTWTFWRSSLANVLSFVSEAFHQP
ncbi:alpha/beta hydrolase [Flavitalea flava]